MNKKRIVISGLIFPVTMLHFFWRAFERREDVDLRVVGPFSNDWIPWKGGIRLPMRYVKYPHIPLPQNLSGSVGMSPAFIQGQLPWEPDLWIQIDAGWWLQKPKATVVAHIATDPHVLDYDRQRKECDVFFNMQTPYMKPGDRYLPYAYDKEIHYPILADKVYNAALVGLQYETRTKLVNRLRQGGLRVYYETGIVYDEYREIYNQSDVALSWSSLLDMPARVWEAFAMSVPLVTNRVPDLSNWFVEKDHFLGFNDVDEAERQVRTLLNDPEYAAEMSENVYRKVTAAHSYDHRVNEILSVCKII